MTPERFARLKEAVLAAKALPPGERRAYLDQACADDATLRAEVESLLAEEVRTDDLLPPPFAAGAHAELPEQIGPYRILGVLGEGGMGVVYRAEQVAPIRRDVALKLIRLGMDTARVVARFEAERQTLALMDHPFIARVLDAGASASGRPYFVMDLVAGRPITTFCEEEALLTRQRLELFLDVCQAVQHAHQRGILHRDLKPTNVLVARQDGRPVPKVIDFGIAKAMADPSGAQMFFTEAGVVVGTPAYMSPEQAGALPGGMDTRSDVYSLGVMLYELLTGLRPRSPEGTPAEVLRTLAEATVAAPSTAARRGGGPDRLRRELAGDLDNIVLKALQKERDRRYASVEQLADDVRRHLEGRPVRARPATWSYRAGRFARRHRAGVAMASAVAALATAFVVSLAVQSGRVARERDRALAAERRARLEAATAQRVSEFLLRLFRVSDPSEARGSTVTAREILDTAAARIASELSDEPALRATMMHTIAGVYLSLGLVNEARPLAEEAFRLRRQLHGESHPEVADSLAGLARLRASLGDHAWAAQALADAVHVYGTSLGEGHPRAIAARTERGAALLANGQLPEAEAELRQAVTLARGLESDPDGLLPRALTRLGRVLTEKSEFAHAEPLLREALQGTTRLWGEQHPESAMTMNALANTLMYKTDYAEAEPLMRRSLELQRKMLGDDHPDVADVLNNLSAILKERVRPAEAEILQREALRIWRRKYGARHPQVASALGNLANLRHDQGDLAGAERLHREELALKRAILQDDHPDIATAIANLANLLHEKREYEEAEVLARDALARDRRIYGDEHFYITIDLNNLGLIVMERGRSQEAERLFREAVAMRRRLHPPGNPQIGHNLVVLGRFLLAEERWTEAEEAVKEMLSIRRATLAADDWRLDVARSMLGACWDGLGKRLEARPLLEESYAALRVKKGDTHPETVFSLRRLVRHYERTGDASRAAEYRSRLPSGKS